MSANPRVDELRGWFEAHGSFLYCWLRARLNPRVRRDIDAEDLLQEVWVRASRLERPQPVESPRSWLLAVAGYVFLEAVRGWRRRTSGTAGDKETALDVPDDVTSFTRRIARAELRQQFFAELDALADEERLLLVQHGLEGRPMAQVAQQLAVTTEAAHKRWQRLRDRLRTMGSPADLM